jgi:hypothetical protein
MTTQFWEPPLCTAVSFLGTGQSRRGQEQTGSELTIDTPNASKSLSFRNQSIEDSSNLPDPDVIAPEIIEDLEAALQPS